jgi:thiol-disulfide isomerase/thioredoxin
MKNKLLIVILICCTLLFSFTFSRDTSDKLVFNNLMFEFVATNGYGNNIYIDNFRVGVQYNNDLAIAGFNLQDKNYLVPGQTSIMVLPVVTINNNGKNSNSGATVTMVVTSPAYSSTKPVPVITPGYSATVNFDSISFSSNVSKDVKIFITWASDQWHYNDTLIQATIFHPGVKRKVLYEAHTSTTCGPCASMNPYLDAFVQDKFDSLVPIKYHAWWPATGDPMFNANPDQARVRIFYNGINSIPALMVDGIILQISSYNVLSNLQNPLTTRLATGAPLSISVTDTRIAGDSIKANVTVNIVSPLSPNGNFRLRAVANERKITYSTPPGSNGETIFYDVFRWMYPNTDGIQIPLTTGTYNYEFRYKRQAAWVDSMMYTAVFVQNDVTKEVMNCNKARNYYVDNVIAANKKFNNTVTDVSGSQVCLNNEIKKFDIQSGYYFENFETLFPAPGWQLINPDYSTTFMQYASTNGPSFPGTHSIRYNCFMYDAIGQMDYLKTMLYSNIDPSDSLIFEYAHAVRPGYTDRLRLLMSTNGGVSFPNVVFDKSGSVLATAPDQSTSFVPSSSSQWGRFAIRIGDIPLGVEPVGNNIPASYSLSQNYPNPFNPKTIIKFTIPSFEGGMTVLKVYDVLGKEVATLINENLKAGSYETEFDGSNLSSGIYFYKLKTNNFSSVKRMLLVK